MQHFLSFGQDDFCKRRIFNGKSAFLKCCQMLHGYFFGQDFVVSACLRWEKTTLRGVNAGLLIGRDMRGAGECRLQRG